MAANIPYPFQEQKRCSFTNIFSTPSPNILKFLTYKISEKYEMHFELDTPTTFDNSRTDKELIIPGENVLSPPNHLNLTYSACRLDKAINQSYLIS